MDTMSIIITASSLLGLVITIISLFFDLKNSKRKIHKKDMLFMIIWFGLAILGFVNLYYKHNENSIVSEGLNNSIQTTNVQENNSEQEAETDEKTNNFSEEKLLIQQNFDLIQQLKSEYTNKDTLIIEDDTVNIFFSERAGYLFHNLKKTEKTYELDGIVATPLKAIILDYYSDEIIYSYNLDQEGNIEYSPGDKNKFYCVFLHTDYEISVTPPISAVGGEYGYGIPCYINTRDDKYTSLFQIRIYIQGLNSDNINSNIFDDYIIKIQCNDMVSGNNGEMYEMEISEFGILSYNENTYFSLNTDYEMSIFLYRKNDNNSELVAQKTFDGSVTNSNQIDIFFILDNKNDILN